MSRKPLSVTLRLVCALLVVGVSLTAAADVTLVWDPSDDPSVVSYKVYVGTASRTYDAPIPIGLQTTYQVIGLSPRTYFFAVTAVNEIGLESGFSNEVSTTIVEPMRILGDPQVSLMDPTSVVVFWTTNRPADSVVEYGGTTAYESAAAVQSAPAIAHGVLLTGLTPGKEYHYRVKSTDASGAAVSQDFRFQAAAAGSLVVKAMSIPNGIEGSAGQPPGEYSGLSLVNFDSGDATLLFWARGADGSIIQAPGLVNPAIRKLKAGGQISVVLNQLFGPGLAQLQTPAWIRLESNVSRLAGVSAVFDAGLTMLDTANVPVPGMNMFVLGEIDRSTRVDLRNPNSSMATVILDLHSPDGSLQASQTRSIPGDGALHLNPFDDVFSGLYTDDRGYIRGRSDRAIAPIEVWKKEGAYIAELNGQDAWEGSSLLYAPHYVENGAYHTMMSVMNLDGIPGTVSFRMIGDDGKQIGDARILTVDGYGKLRIDDPAFFAPGPVRGYVEVNSTDIRLSGTVVFIDPARSAFAAALPMTATLRTSSFFGQAVSDETYFTGMAVLNPGISAANVSVTVYGSDGTLVATRTLPIAPNARVSGLLTEICPDLAGRPLHSGYVVVKSDVPVTGFSLFGTHDLTLLAAISGQLVP